MYRNIAGAGCQFDRRPGLLGSWRHLCCRLAHPLGREQCIVEGIAQGLPELYGSHCHLRVRYDFEGAGAPLLPACRVERTGGAEQFLFLLSQGFQGRELMSVGRAPPSSQGGFGSRGPQPGNLIDFASLGSSSKQARDEHDPRFTIPPRLACRRGWRRNGWSPHRVSSQVPRTARPKPSRRSCSWSLTQASQVSLHHCRRRSSDFPSNSRK